MNVVVVRETVDVGKGGTSTFITVCIFFWFNVQTMLVSLGPLSSKSQDGIEDAGDGWGEMPERVKRKGAPEGGSVFRPQCRSDLWQRRRVAWADVNIAVQFEERFSQTEGESSPQCSHSEESHILPNGSVLVALPC